MGNVLAEAILLLHFLFVLFVTGGFALILAGAALGWSWIRARGFRSLHLGAILLQQSGRLRGVITIASITCTPTITTTTPSRTKRVYVAGA